MKTSKITIKSLFGISEQMIGGKSIEITGRKGAGKTSVLDAMGSLRFYRLAYLKIILHF